MSNDVAAPRLDSFDPLPETTAPAEPTVTAEPAAADTAEPELAALTAEDLALIEAQPDGEEPAEADTPAETDTSAEGEAAEEDHAGEAKDEDQATDKPTANERPTDPEELAAWRAERGIPNDAASYEFPDLDDWAEEDKAALTPFVEAFLDADVSQESAQKILRTYAAQLDALHKADKTHRDEARNTLKGEWGDKYASHIKAMKDYVLEQPFGELIAGARLPNGRLLLNDPGIAQWLVGIAEVRPVARTPEQRLAEINEIRDTDIDRYRSEGLDREWVSLTKSIVAKPSAGRVESEAGLRAELAEITKLMNTDIDRYMNKPTWRGSGKTASQRALEIQRHLAGDRPAA